jgi:hypothetical protein
MSEASAPEVSITNGRKILLLMVAISEYFFVLEWNRTSAALNCFFA